MGPPESPAQGRPVPGVDDYLTDKGGLGTPPVERDGAAIGEGQEPPAPLIPSATAGAVAAVAGVRPTAIAGDPDRLEVPPIKKAVRRFAHDAGPRVSAHPAPYRRMSAKSSFRSPSSPP